MVCAAQQSFDQLIGGSDKKKRDSQAQRLRQFFGLS
jgi:hypothetical protein